MKIVVLFAFVMATVTNALAYGKEGHEAIGELARQMLTPSARASIQRILGNDDLAGVSIWADELKLAKKRRWC